MKCYSYVSKPNQSFDEGDLQQLRDKAVTMNRSHGITGYLYFGSNRFFQYFEAEDTAADSLMLNIQRDTRHTILERMVMKIDDRKFPDWNMRWVSYSELMALKMEKSLSEFILLLSMPLPEKIRWNQEVVLWTNHLARLYLCGFLKKKMEDNLQN